jgi:hypothetical protein
VFLVDMQPAWAYTIAIPLFNEAVVDQPRQTSRLFRLGDCAMYCTPLSPGPGAI